MAKRQCYWCGVWSEGQVCRCCGDDLDQQARNLERWERERLEKQLRDSNRERASEIRQR